MLVVAKHKVFYFIGCVVAAQKISPEGKAKVQLQVVLHNGASSTFHFSNKGGLQAQLADRDKVKELLQSLLPKFKRKVSGFFCWWGGDG